MFNARLLRNGTAVTMATASGGDVGDTIGCDYPSFIEIGPLVSEL